MEVTNRCALLVPAESWSGCRSLCLTVEQHDCELIINKERIVNDLIYILRYVRVQMYLLGVDELECLIQRVVDVKT